MARIQNTTDYPVKASPVLTDFLIGTDSEDSNKTVSFTVQSLRGEIEGTLYTADGIIDSARVVTYQGSLTFFGSLAASQFTIQKSLGPGVILSSSGISVGTTGVSGSFAGIVYDADFS